MLSVNYGCVKESTKWFLDAAGVTFRITFDDVMMFMTLFVLFADNIRLMVADKNVDDDFIVVNSLCLFAFIIELLANTWSKTDNMYFDFLYFFDEEVWIPWFFCDGFMFSFFWWLDLIAILSMFPDIPWIADPMGIGGISNSYDASNAITKFGRVLRLVRLVRLVKLYKIMQIRSRKAKEEQELMQKVRSGQVSFEDIAAQRAAMVMAADGGSKLGEQLSESTTRRVVVLVLVMVCVLPLLDVPTVNYGPAYGTAFLHEVNQITDTNTLSDAVKYDLVLSYLDVLKKTTNGREMLLSLYMYPFSSDTLSWLSEEEYTDKISALRPEAMETVSHTTGSTVTTAIFSNKHLEYDYALFSTLTTLFIACLLVIGSLVFTTDTQNMVIAPIERMMNMVESVARDPLKPLTFDHSGEVGSGEYETRLLEGTIEKITGLLRVGFGEAGAGIISANLQTRAKGQQSGAVNPLLPGVRIFAVIGFCDIHHFEEINNDIKDDVLTFVNTVAEIVHSRVHYWGGQVNKNLGNAFVILWRIGDELDVQMQTQGQNPSMASMKSMKAMNKSGAPGITAAKSKVIDLRRVPGVDKLSDHALVGYLKIIAEINRDPKVLAYRNEPRLTHNGTKPFKVSMGFGLHAGWAIEGAVGSIHKVDATYLSPHVNMAARLETSSRQYGVPILISQNAFELFSPDCQHLCRKCDVVTVKGSEVPIAIYTYDALQDQMFTPKFIQQVDDPDEAYELCPEELEARMDINERRLEHGLPMIEADAFPLLDLEDWDDETEPNYEPTGALKEIPYDDWRFQRTNVDSQDLFEGDSDLLVLRAHANNEEFLATFKTGVTLYLDGDWVNGKVQLEKANNLMKTLAPSLGGDGPCLTLLDYMQEFGPNAPDWWKGYRPLTAK